MILKNENKKSESAKRAFAFLLWGRNVGALPQTPTKGLFVKSPLEPQKLSPKEIGVFGGSSLTHLSLEEKQDSLNLKNFR